MDIEASVKIKNRRVCLYCGDETFPKTHEDYMPCQECGAATYKAFQRKEPNFRASKCPNAEECYLLDQYRPECECLTFTPRCLVALHAQLEIQDLKLDKILQQQN